MKITDHTKQRLLAIPIEQVAEKLGISVTRHTALCFLHDDHHPSLAFTPAKNRWRCYVCNVWGDNIALVQKYNNQSFVEACMWLGQAFGIDTGDAGSASAPVAVRQREAVARKAEEATTLDTEILQAMTEHFGLTATARRFLFDSRRYSEDVVENLRLFSVEKESELIDFLICQFGVQRTMKAQLLFKHDNKFTSYFHAPCVFFPYFDMDGALIGLQARYLGRSERCQRFQFPKGSQTHVFNQPVLRRTDEHAPLFVSEGVTDAIALMSAGYDAIAIPSATLLKAEELRPALSRPLLMYPDNDAPGMRLFNELKEIATQAGGTLTKLYLPSDCKDFSEHFLKNISPQLPRSGSMATTLFF